jgi:hypothetical protein
MLPDPFASCSDHIDDSKPLSLTHDGEARPVVQLVTTMLTEHVHR